MNKYLTEEFFVKMIELTGGQQELVLVRIYGVLQSVEGLVQSDRLKTDEILETIGMNFSEIINSYSSHNQQQTDGVN